MPVPGPPLRLVRRGFFLVAVVGLGAGCGFLMLESIGLPFMAASLVSIVFAGRGRGSWLSLLLGAFGLGYTGIVTWFLGADLGPLAAMGATSDIAWLILLLLIGAVMIAAAVALEVTRPYR